jgi:hypothetical protein
MGEIYKRASKVLTWLGEPSSKEESFTTGSEDDLAKTLTPDYSQPLVEWVHNVEDVSVLRSFFTDEKTFEDWPVVGALSTLVLLARDCHLNTLPFFQDPRYAHFNIGIYPSELWQQSSKALSRLLSSPYWSRVWIVQEIVLGNQVQVHYGRHIVPLQIFVEAERLMRKHYYGCCYSLCC